MRLSLLKIIHRDEIYRSEASEQAELLNEYFYEQFTSPSKYDIFVSPRLDDTI